jgi:hypothetical protein
MEVVCREGDDNIRDCSYVRFDTDDDLAHVEDVWYTYKEKRTKTEEGGVIW